MREILRDILSISSGKLAHLTGFSDYESLDRVQQEWFAFAQAQDKDYKNWMEAWEAFSAQQGKGA